ncbi:MAG: UvrD-helicase domain-containing protein [Janthinobacterium lividum]
MNQHLLTWLKDQQATIDQVIYQAANRYYRHQRDTVKFSNLDYDIGITTLESFNLSDGKDLCYDRPTIGYTYSLWYHARRVNTFLMYFLREMTATSATSLDIFDLGAGTGAVQWAVGLVLAGMKSCGLPTPRLNVINVDSSPFMLEYNRDYLWQQFLLAYPVCQEISCSFNVNSWSTPAEGSGAQAWVVSSYLFDHVENKEFLADGFQALVRLYQPERVLMLTSAQQTKKAQLNLVAQAVKSVGYQLTSYDPTTPLFRGQLPMVTSLRRALKEKRHLPVPSKEVTWDDHSFSAVALFRTQAAFSFAATTPASIKELQLYVTPLVVRREIKLNESQEKAAAHTSQPTVITGPAGCGKSVVITERIHNLVKEHDYDPNLRILLTSFNIKLIDNLKSWLASLLDRQKAWPVTEGFRFANSNVPNITCLHFDVLPTQIGRVHDKEKADIRHNEWHFGRMSGIAREVLRAHQLPEEGSHKKVLNPEFLLEEFHRVVYGLGYLTAEEYLEQPRTGRGNKIPHRALVWQCFERYFEQLSLGQSFTNRRLQFLRALRDGSVQRKFDHIFVDEYQDCTPADLEIFRHLLHNPDCIVLAGDLAQAVQIGRTSAAEKRFRHFMGLKQDRRNIRLQGSYRLPFRISEAIRGVSEQINTLYKGDQDAGVISPYKGSPPGARPILVYAENLPQLADKISEIIRTFSSFDLQDVTILEKEPMLARALRERDVLNVDTDTILKLKGLEKTCIVWATNTAIEHRGEVFEFIYTILTRTSCLLIITLTPNTLPLYIPIVKELRADRLICWDKQASEKFHLLQEQEMLISAEDFIESED